MCYKRIFYQGIREAGSSVLKITPNGIEISALNIDVDSSDLTLVKGALVKINSGGSVSGKKPIDTSNVKAAPDAEKFEGYEGNETAEIKRKESVIKSKIEAEPDPEKSRVPGMSPKDANIAIKQAMIDLKKALNKRKSEINEWNESTQKSFKTWFGKTDKATRKMIIDRIDRMTILLDKYTLENFKPANPSEEGQLAYVYADDDSVIYLDKGFSSAPAIGRDSKMGILAHEMAHFKSIGGTDDYGYGEYEAKKLAKDNSDNALDNSDNFEYFIEG